MSSSPRLRSPTTFHVSATHTYKGSMVIGLDCLQQTASTCLETNKCAWCPSSHRCFPYDKNHRSLCETQDSCRFPLWTRLAEVPVPSPTVVLNVFVADSLTPTPTTNPDPNSAFNSVSNSAAIDQPTRPETNSNSNSNVENDPSSATGQKPIDDYVDIAKPTIVQDYRMNFGITAEIQPIFSSFDNDIGREHLMIEEVILFIFFWPC
jgi:hypothetical protein